MRNSFPTTTSQCQTQIRVSSPQGEMLISSAADHPKREIHAQSTFLQQQNSTSVLPTSTSTVPQENTPRRVKIVKSKEQIQEHYPELFKGIG